MSSLAGLVVALTYPPVLSIGLLSFAVLALLLRWRAVGGVLVALALGWSLLWSLPQVSEWLRAPLEAEHRVVSDASLPHADAIVVLGGGTVRPERLDTSRLGEAARAWRAGRAPTVILSGGGGRGGTGRGRTEAQRMAEAIVTLGVPQSALVLEERSHSTLENAQFTARLARERHIRDVLLVTSAVHMPRASLLFRDAGIDAIPVPVPESTAPGPWMQRWLPTRRALWRSGRALKEYAGLIALSVGIGESSRPALTCATLPSE
jgi:uncharacterized SAM-binding protein YcdF (DUF218 family)